MGCSMSIPPHCAWGREIKNGEEKPTNKGCRRALREAHERDRFTNEIVRRAASGGALAPEPPRATRAGPEPLPVSNPFFPSVFPI